MKTGKALNRSTLRSHPLPPVINDDKDAKGRLLVVAGSRDIPGAALLTATAAMRSGAGKLRIATGQSVAIAVGAQMPEAMVIGLSEDGEGGLDAGASKAIGKLAAESDAVVAGPGLALNDHCSGIAAALVKADAQVALDAALLHALKPTRPGRQSQPILLPHAGELASLLNIDEEDVDRDPVGCGLRAADRYGAIVLVKGVVSHVVTVEGDVWTYSGGVPGLGVSGSGDVLAGIVAGLLARGAQPLNALLWSVWLHGEAGARLTKKVGPVGFLAREIAAEVPALLPR